MPDPLLGFALQSFVPPVQLYAVSGAVALLSLECHCVPPERLSTVANAEALRQTFSPSYGRVVETSLAYRALLRTKVRHFDSAG
jgi:hypothetical protein